MVTMTLAVPAELKIKMDFFPEINWSEVARQAFAQKVDELQFLKNLKKNSSLTEGEALLLGDRVSRKLAKRLLEKS